MRALGFLFDSIVVHTIAGVLIFFAAKNMNALHINTTEENKNPPSIYHVSITGPKLLAHNNKPTRPLFSNSSKILDKNSDQPTSLSAPLKNQNSITSSLIVNPIYPPSSRRKGEEGLVIVSVRSTSKTKKLIIELKRSSGFRDLDRAAIQAVKTAVLDKPFYYEKNFSIRFQLSNIRH